jgi:hypothetical protein
MKSLISIKKHGGDLFEVVSKGEYDTLNYIMNELTNELETRDIFMVNECTITNNSLVREFATKKEGWVMSLLIVP